MASSISLCRLTTSLQLSRDPFGTRKRGTCRLRLKSPAFGFQSRGFQQKQQIYIIKLRHPVVFKSLLNCSESASPKYFQRQSSCLDFLTVLPVCSSDESQLLLAENNHYETGFIRVEYLVKVLHQSAKSFAAALECHESAWNGLQLSKAWVGVDVHAWHKHIAYQVAVYSFLQTATTQVNLLYDEPGEDLDPAHKILSQTISTLKEHIEYQLNTRDSKLVELFRKELLPLLAGYFTPILGRWSANCLKSGVAVAILAITCCVAVRKLGAERISCPSFTSSIQESIGKLMNLGYGLLPAEKLHDLATKAGFEQEFLTHFGSKVPHCTTKQDVVFWSDLVHRKLTVAFRREGVVASLQSFTDAVIVETYLATLGFFAFLGRRTRLFLSSEGIKDLDDPVKDFISYLECGSLFVCPSLSTISVYQHFVEVVSEEIGWIDFYAEVPRICHRERKRSKQHAIQAEQEIIFSTVFSICSDVFSSFAHFSKSTQRSLDPKLVDFMIRSQNLLNICLDDYWAAYDGSSELLKISDVSVPEQAMPSGHHGMVHLERSVATHQKPVDLIMRGPTAYIPKRVPPMSKSSMSERMHGVLPDKLHSVAKEKPMYRSFLRKSSRKLISTSSDIWMGTRLLFIDMSVALGLLWKQIRHNTLTQRETKKLKRTLGDIASVVPVAILILIPVSAVGHAAIFAAIKKYVPFLIPSPYSSERLDVIKQLDRTKKMAAPSLSAWSTLDVSF